MKSCWRMWWRRRIVFTQGKLWTYHATFLTCLMTMACLSFLYLSGIMGFFVTGEQEQENGNIQDLAMTFPPTFCITLPMMTAISLLQETLWQFGLPSPTLCSIWSLFVLISIPRTRAQRHYKLMKFLVSQLRRHTKSNNSPKLINSHVCHIFNTGFVILPG